MTPPIFVPPAEAASLTPEALEKTLGVNPGHGISNKEATIRRRSFGDNTTETAKKIHVVIEYLLNFKNPLVLILIVVSVVSFFLGEMVNAGIILSMVFLSTTLNFFQEHRASAAAEKLKAKLAVQCSVKREARVMEIPAREVVVGDIIVLNAGDLVPADARLLTEKDLYISESAVTGESFPVEKHAIDSLVFTGPAEAKNMVFAGTSVVSGTAEAVVYATGKHTEVGAIAHGVIEGDNENDFTRGIATFGTFILRTVVVFVVVIFILNTLLKHDVLSSLTFAVAVAVGLTPEFLPMIMTVTMSRGSVRMARKGVVVKRLTAIPTLGSMNVLATDKTGTLTEDHVRLVRYVDWQGHDSVEVLERAYVNAKLQTGLTNPLDAAVLEHRGVSTKGYIKLDEIPFDFHRRLMSIVVKKSGKRELICKGAPEMVMKRCTTTVEKEVVTPLTPKKQKQIMELFTSLSQSGFRVLAIAGKTVPTKISYTKNDEDGLTFYGFTAFLDPAKDGVLPVIKELERLGIEVKIVTGDNELVTAKICADVGLPIKGMLLGQDIEKMSDTELGQRARDVTVFARFSPEQKARVIRAMRADKSVVGYMGDGVNDALSLKAADVGLSVDNAVDIAKESADFILTHKSLEILKEGVTEGRKTFGNTMKYIMMGLSSNFGNMFSVLGAVLLLPFLPMLPIQILLNNFLYDLSQLTIPLDNVDREYIDHPKRWDIRFIRNFMLIMGPISSAFDFATFYLLYAVFKVSPAAFQTGWFLESLATQTLVIHIIRTRRIPFLQSRPHPWLWWSTALVVIFGWLLPFTSLDPDLGFVRLGTPILTTLIFVVFGYFAAAELGKRLFYRLTPASL